jgi:CubicO group peptidase (beta-lactamase class C family)
MNTVEGTATTLNKSVITDVLRNDLGFQGLVVTDALEMKGVSSYHAEGELEVKAIQAGNDILLLPTNMEKAIAAITKALKEGRIDSLAFEQKVKRILAAKYEYQAHQVQKLSKQNMHQDINTDYTKGLIQNLYNASLTLVKNDSNALPLSTDVRKRYAVVNIGDKARNAFTLEASRFHKVSSYSLPRQSSLDAVKQLAAKLHGFDAVIINVLGTNNSARKNYGIYQSSIQLLQLTAQKTQVICNVFANPYCLDRFEELNGVDAIMVAYQDNDYSMKAAANAIFGGLHINGKIPFSKSKLYPAGHGLTLLKSRIGYVGPMQMKVGAHSFKEVNRIAQAGIDSGAYPGCQILVVKDGEVIYQENFGYHTYLRETEISDTSVYDLASVTKILATTVSLMKLNGEDQFNPDKRLGFYLADAKGSNKEYLVIRDILAHQGRLNPWIPFYRHTMNGNQLDSNLYRSRPSRYYESEVANGIFMLDTYRDSIISDIYASELRSRKRYKYSDLGMYLMKEIIEQQSEQRLDQYCNESFYFPLGMQHTAFNPLTRFDTTVIVPTEKDNYFRYQLIHGYVHDQGAAMIGGVSGHAGLFATSNDIAIIMQMLLQQGNYGGVQYIDTAAIEDFTRQQFPLNDNRRGMGFDRPLENPEQGGPTCPYVSQKSFGHSGFTGTYVWTDPSYNLTYVFLSNRVYPSAENRKLISMDIRTRIQGHIYQSLGLVPSKEPLQSAN